MAFLHKEEDDHNHTNKKKEYGAEDRYYIAGKLCEAQFLQRDNFSAQK